MSSTVDLVEEMTTDFQTEAYSREVSTSAEQSPGNKSALIVLKTTVIVVGVLGTLSNGLVLGGFGLSSRSKMTTSSIHIANHTILELSPFS